MSKLSKVLTVLILLLIGVVGYMMLQSSSTSDQMPTETQTDYSLQQVETYTQAITPLTDIDESFLSVPSVTVETENPGFYFIGHSFADTANGGPSYVIEYQSQTQYFNVVLLKQPYALAQAEAESELQYTLGMNEADLCALTYSVSVPGYVDDMASGVDYRFSFCADSVPLP